MEQIEDKNYVILLYLLFISIGWVTSQVVHKITICTCQILLLVPFGRLIIPSFRIVENLASFNVSHKKLFLLRKWGWLRFLAVSKYILNFQTMYSPCSLLPSNNVPEIWLQIWKRFWRFIPSLHHFTALTITSLKIIVYHAKLGNHKSTPTKVYSLSWNLKVLVEFFSKFIPLQCQSTTLWRSHTCDLVTVSGTNFIWWFTF